MDAVSYEWMRTFANSVREDSTFTMQLEVIDIGSMDIYGSYRALFPPPKFRYKGLDIQAGKNVDIVADDPYHYKCFDNMYDLVISGSCLEHVEDIYAWADEAIRILKPNGLMAIIVPCKWDEHKYPLDCWRFYPDGLRWLFVKRTGKLDEVRIAHDSKQCMAVFRKKVSDGRGDQVRQGQAEHAGAGRSGTAEAAGEVHLHPGGGQAPA